MKLAAAAAAAAIEDDVSLKSSTLKRYDVRVHLLS